VKDTLTGVPVVAFLSAFARRRWEIRRVCDDPHMNEPLRERLAGVRGLVLDLDGVLVLKGALLPGAVEALATLDAHWIPYVIGTNVSLVSRATLALDLARGGLPIPAERIVSAVSTAAALARRKYGAAPLYVMASADAMTEFDGLKVLSHDEAAEPGAEAAAVVVGDAAEEFSPRNMQSAFRLLRNGAGFVAMHKNRWWLTPAGVTLDSGSYVAALEFATERRALVTGKPSRAFFAEAVRMLARDAGDRPSRPLSPGEVAMVGDDLWNDVRGAQKAGLRGVFVRSGKHGDAELARAATGRGGRAPDAVAPSIVEIVAALAG
jgi:HAD superfamily hydrolase (TIGR01458 family)